MAKSGGKNDGKRGADAKRKKHAAAKADEKDKKSKKKGKRAAEEKAAAARAEAGAAGTAGNGASAKLKSVKLTRAEGTQQLVEQVAAEIVIAELNRATEERRPAVGPPRVPEQSIAAVKAAAGERRNGKAKAKAKGEEQAASTLVVVEPDSQENDSEAAVFSDLLRAPAGAADLASIDSGATPGVSSREQVEQELPRLAARLEELQERLFAAARGGDSSRRVLLLLQGMDTSGKGGTVRHVVGQLDPNGTRLTAFKAPTEEEREHDFLWRIRRALPAAGEVGIFDRSHYEDVLIARVRKLALPMVIGRRYQLINRFERGLVADGAVLVKCFLHISRDEQKQRLLARLDDPAKHWKYNPGDVDERALWPDYQEAYRLALEKCSTDEAPWYVVPADHKWYRNYAITRLLVEALERIDPAYPPGDFNVEVERQRVLAS